MCTYYLQGSSVTFHKTDPLPLTYLKNRMTIAPPRYTADSSPYCILKSWAGYRLHLREFDYTYENEQFRFQMAGFAITDALS